ncbi:MAG: hypothetical protein JOS17DRAFT_770616 [Linnemannia elongata]|nr:MAG: hypothetical protein JOS17DRAFT_770616 [Linnemannia elongata]
MGSTGLRALRIWVIILTFTNLVFIAIHYAEVKYWSNSRNYRIYNYIGTGTTLKSDKLFLWQDWTLIVSSSVLFLAYIYAYKVLATRLHKYFRALLMVVPTALVLFVGIQYIHLVLRLDYPMPEGPPTPFDCAYLSGLERMYCGVVEFSYFFAIITGLFALLEIYVTIRKGPMLPKGCQQLYIPNVGYAKGISVEYVRPPGIPKTKQHQQQLQDPYGGGDDGGGGNQQLSTSDQPFLLSPLKQNTPIHSNSMDPTVTPGSQPLQQLLKALPEEVFDERAPLPHHMIYGMPSIGAQVPFPHPQLDLQPPVNAPMVYPPPVSPTQAYVQPQSQKQHPPSQQHQPPQPQEEEFDERLPLPTHMVYGMPSVGTQAPFPRPRPGLQPPVNPPMVYPPPMPPTQAYVQPQPQKQRPPSQQHQPPQPQEEEFDERLPLPIHMVYGMPSVGTQAPFPRPRPGLQPPVNPPMVYPPPMPPTPVYVQPQSQQQRPPSQQQQPPQPHEEEFDARIPGPTVVADHL